MEEELIRDLERLLETEDGEQIKKIKASIVDNISSDREEIMQKINMYTDTPDEHTRKGIENLIEMLKKQTD